MAHFAKLNDKNEVIEVHVVANAALDPKDEEGSGIAFLTEWSGGYTNWKQTSYNGTIRYNFAGVGWYFDSDADAFISPKPECGHKELMLNMNYKWSCQGCDLDAKKLLDEA